MKKSEQVAFELLLKKNNKFIVSYPYLFSKTLNRAKKIISSGKVGKINYIEINFQQCGSVVILHHLNLLVILGFF